MLNMSLEKRSVKKLYKDGDCWTWEISNQPGRIFYTNNNGEGIWEDWGKGEQQIVGICEFSLKGYSLSGARKKINRIANNYFYNNK